MTNFSYEIGKEDRKFGVTTRTDSILIGNVIVVSLDFETMFSPSYSNIKRKVSISNNVLTNEYKRILDDFLFVDSDMFFKPKVELFNSLLEQLNDLYDEKVA